MKLKSKPWKGELCKYAHHKYDGHFIRIEGGRFYTSNPTDITDQLPSRIRECARLLRSEHIYYGELYVQGEKASAVKTHLKAQSDQLQLVFFATTALEVDATLHRVQEYFWKPGLAFAPFIDVGGHTPESLFALMGEDQEGWMLKNGNLLDWYKLKPVLTCDLVITDVEWGKNKNLGLIGSLVCSAEGREIANVSGMDDAMREWMTDNLDAIIGKVVEVEYQYVGSKGRLRHPRFKQLRDDKKAEDCSLDQF